MSITQALGSGGYFLTARQKAIESVWIALISAESDGTPDYATDISGLDANSGVTTYLHSWQGQESTAICEFNRHNWDRALSLFQSVFRTGAPDDIRGLAAWHSAIAADHLKRHSDAARFIAVAYRAIPNGASGVSKEQIRYDYNRLGGEKLDANARQAEAHQELAENHEYWDGISADERRVIKLNGGTRDDSDFARPCHVSESTSSLGDLIIWYYNCIGDNNDGIGTTSYEFLNGSFQGQTTL